MESVVTGNTLQLLLTRNHLQANRLLHVRVSEVIDWLARSSSSFNKKGTRGISLKSEKTNKLTSQSIVPHLWPHSHLNLAYNATDQNYDKLTHRMYPHPPAILPDTITLQFSCITQYTWSAVQEFHVVVLFVIECTCWVDPSAHLESHVYPTPKPPLNSALPVNQVQFYLGFPEQQVYARQRSLWDDQKWKKMTTNIFAHICLTFKLQLWMPLLSRCPEFCLIILLRRFPIYEFYPTI